MKSLLYLSFILVIVSCGEYESRCKGDAACEECALSWFCEYGNKEDQKEECYKNCVEHKIAYDQHKDVNNAQETTVHEKKAFIQMKEFKEQCLNKPTCEACALSWQCSYGQSQELIEKCYEHCLEQKVPYDTHDSVRAAEETTVH
eukprot:TRINITY_DN3511_c0_g2_i1.p3 TRINITY_DN3511_c0_g2~~TRINITY_DN3511_c0_g2_i1.p3  ORF type:complete len:145 (-),score=20.84 TRINITY_DN3511_c0_g2_i1:97-531(-)